MLYHAEFLGEVIHKAYTEFDPDDRAHALTLMLNDYKEKGLNLLTAVADPQNNNTTILVFTVYQSGDNPEDTPGQFDVIV